MQPVVDRLSADPQSLRDHLDRPLIAEQQQGTNALNGRNIATLKGDAQEMLQVLDSRSRQVYFGVQGIPPGATAFHGSVRQHTVSRPFRHLESNSFSEDL
jgi:hypothetical protein